MSRGRAAGGVVGTARSVVAHARAADVATLAAAVAYYAFVSVLPLVVVAFTLASLFAGEAVAARVLAATSGLLTDSGEAVIDSALTEGAGRGGTTLIGLAVLVWSGLRLFRGLDTAFARVYEGGEEESFLTSLVDAFLVFAASGVAVGVSVLAAGVVAVVGGPLTIVLGPPGSVAGLTLVFLPVFYVFPNRPVTLREVVPGAVVAAVGWTLLNTVFVVYAALASVSAYGLIGAVLLLVTWFYLAAVIVLFGASLNVVLADRARGAESAGV